MKIDEILKLNLNKMSSYFGKHQADLWIQINTVIICGDSMLYTNIECVVVIEIYLCQKRIG